MKKQFALVASTFLVSTALHADIINNIKAAPNNFYVGGEIGYYDTNINGNRFDDDGFNGGFVAGWRKGHVGVELGYNMTDSPEQDATIGATPVETSLQLDTVSVDVLGYVPLGGAGTDFVAGIGYGFTTANTKVSDGLTIDRSSDEGDALRFTAGVEQMISSNFSARALYRYSDYGDGVIESRNDFNVGVLFYF